LGQFVENMNGAGRVCTPEQRYHSDTGSSDPIITPAFGTGNTDERM
jgi:hypothetical protein